MATIAFIGLGHMGGGMAPNLAKAGHDVRAFDLSEEALDARRRAGLHAAPRPPKRARTPTSSSPCCPPASMSREVYRKPMFAPSAKTGALLIDCSTIDVASAREVGRGRGGARASRWSTRRFRAASPRPTAGTLTFMVGGIDDGFERAQPFLEPMAKAVIHAGEPGAGQAAKICNNMLLGATMAATCEAFVLAQKLGLDPQIFFDISSKASGQSWSMTSYCPVPGVGPETPADHDYEGGFAAALMLKDLKLAMEAAQERRRLHADGRRSRGALPALRRPRRRRTRISPASSR